MMALRLVLIFHFIVAVFSVNLGLTGVVKKIHKGIDEVVKGTIKGATEVTGTPVEPKDVHFFLITSNNKNGSDEIIDQFNPKKVAETEGEIFFFIHGWTQNRTSCPWYKPLSEVLLGKYPDAHIVQTDWGKPAGDNYAYAAFSTESVAQIIANVIQKLVNQFQVPQNRIILIGHSLGGQIAGWTGKKYRKVTNKTLPRIIALDPAGPIFDVRPDSRRLNKNDAEVVMVVHSDMRKFGFPTNTGSIDFFPNGGISQPGCSQVNLTDLSLSALTEPLWCGHRRAHDLFIEAVKYPPGFEATKCDNYEDYKKHKCVCNEKVSMGNWLTNATGSFFLKTTGQTPFIKTDTSEESSKNSKCQQNKE